MDVFDLECEEKKMELGNSSALQQELLDWCNDALVQPDHALLLLDVSADAGIAFIESTIETVKIFGRVRLFGRVRVRSSKEGPSETTLLVLCECREKIDLSRVPAEVLPKDGDPPWKIVVVRDKSLTLMIFQQNSENFRKLLQDEGKSMTDVQALFSPLPTSSPEAVIRTVGELLEKTTKRSGDSTAYKRLRVFSGVVPTPAGEETMENWIEQAKLMIAESDCAEKEKRKRIVESLKGPALEIIKAVRLSNGDASASEYLVALESAFGTSESGEDLYFAFRLLRQNSGEALSEFLRRMEKSLTKVVQRGGLQPAQVDRVRIEQLLRGAVESDLMLSPTFLKLLNEIREEEENEAARCKLDATVKPLIPKASPPPKPTEIQAFKAEVKELRAKLEESRKAPASPEPPKQKAKMTSESAEARIDPKVQSLNTQVQQLQKQLTLMNVESSATQEEQHFSGKL